MHFPPEGVDNPHSSVNIYSVLTGTKNLKKLCPTRIRDKTMKSKLLLIAAFGGLLATLGSCSDDPKNSYETGQEFEIRQVRLEATNETNTSFARSSENPASAAATLEYPIIYSDGTAATNVEGEPEIATVNILKPTNAVIAKTGDVLELKFLPGNNVVNNITLTFPDGQTQQLNEENTTLKWTVSEFADGDVIKAQQIVSDKGSTYKYTGAIYLWHYHEVVLQGSDNATGSSAYTAEFNVEKNAIVKVPVLEDGQIVFDENGNVVFETSNIIVANNGDEIALRFVPGYSTDTLNVTLPDGEDKTLNAESATLSWHAETFTDGAEISAKIVLKQPDAGNLEFTRNLIINHPQAAE